MRVTDREEADTVARGVVQQAEEPQLGHRKMHRVLEGKQVSQPRNYVIRSNRIVLIACV